MIVFNHDALRTAIRFAPVFSHDIVRLSGLLVSPAAGKKRKQESEKPATRRSTKGQAKTVRTKKPVAAMDTAKAYANLPTHFVMSKCCSLSAFIIAESID